MFSHTSARGKILLIVYIDDIIITGDDKKGIDWDARTRPQGRRNHVRRGGTRGRGKDVAGRTSVPRRATWQVPNRADAAEVGADSAEIGADAAKIGSTRSVSAETAESGRN